MTAKLPALTLPQAIKILTDLTGWNERQVCDKPTDAAWDASGRVYEARNVIDGAKNARRNGLL